MQCRLKKSDDAISVQKIESLGVLDATKLDVLWFHLASTGSGFSRSKRSFVTCLEMTLTHVSPTSKSGGLETSERHLRADNLRCYGNRRYRRKEEEEEKRLYLC